MAFSSKNASLFTKLLSILGLVLCFVSSLSLFEVIIYKDNLWAIPNDKNVNPIRESKVRVLEDFVMYDYPDVKDSLNYEIINPILLMSIKLNSNFNTPPISPILKLISILK